MADIISHKVIRGEYYFTVRWVGYPEPGFEDSTEPLKNLWGAEILLRKYLAKKQKDVQYDEKTGCFRIIPKSII